MSKEIHEEVISSDAKLVGRSKQFLDLKVEVEVETPTGTQYFKMTTKEANKLATQLLSELQFIHNSIDGSFEGNVHFNHQVKTVSA